jgi:HEAT repeat protein
LTRKFLASLRKRNAERSPEERQRLHEEQAARAEAMEEDLIEQLGDPDPSVRAEAASELPLGGEGEEGAERLQRLARIAADDPDPRVRIAAVGRLGESDSPNAVNPLVEALDDPDREVVLEALDALQDRNDASLIPYLDPLLQDPDPEIREKAGFTREWLQW